MIIENMQAIQDFAKKHPFSRNVLSEWIKKVENASWNNFVELKETFNSADYRKPHVIFDIGGNKYRLVARVLYSSQKIIVVRVGTHAEYDGWSL